MSALLSTFIAHAKFWLYIDDSAFWVRNLKNAETAVEGVTRTLYGTSSAAMAIELFPLCRAVRVGAFTRAGLEGIDVKGSYCHYPSIMLLSLNDLGPMVATKLTMECVLNPLGVHI